MPSTGLHPVLEKVSRRTSADVRQVRFGSGATSIQEGEYLLSVIDSYKGRHGIPFLYFGFLVFIQSLLPVNLFSGESRMCFLRLPSVSYRAARATTSKSSAASVTGTTLTRPRLSTAPRW